MAEIIQFTSKAESDAAQNLTEFIRVCRDELTAFGADLPFAENVWDISAHNEVKGRQKATRVVFSNLAASWKSEPAVITRPKCAARARKWATCARECVAGGKGSSDKGQATQLGLAAGPIVLESARCQPACVTAWLEAKASPDKSSGEGVDVPMRAKPDCVVATAKSQSCYT